MEHAVTDDINGRADIEEARAENQALKDEIQALKDENQALKAGTPDDSDKCGTSRYIKADVPPPSPSPLPAASPPSPPRVRRS